MNFCCEEIGTTISVNQVEAEGYEAQNLITNDLNLQSTRGFMTDSFVRPPVTISIKFPFCIELSHIVIGPKVGKQSSSGFIIHTETSYKSWTKDHNGPVSTHLVAKEFLNTPVPNAIVFRNPRFVLRRPFSSLPTEHYSKYKNHEVLFNLKHPSFNACERVVGLDITILKVSDSSIPAISGVQVWGQPCIRCSQDQVEKLYKSWSRIIRRGETYFAPPLRSAEPPSDEPSLAKKPKLSSSADSGLSIPDDFLDAITYEIMCQPIRLPCGLAVDAITLEKYYAEESKFGRLPNDPFTGITFTETLKPVSDAALKSRIDLFISQNADDEAIINLPRSLGSMRPTSQRNNYVFRNPNVCATSTISSSRRRQTTFGSAGFSNPDLFDAPIYAKEGKTFADHKDKCTVPSSSQSLDPEDHLNYELFKFLASESPFYTPNPKVSAKIKCKDCSLPISMKHGISTFYIGLCDHVILCRNCLAKTDKQAHKTCSRCGVEWRAKDCLRIFI
ncbi:unnamed protein product [Orchesella dallaii]|uniref:U-box domain-containing protein n=1 Tax=Orchesella dallaii TaxID=48710 RepID=A0ABP1R3H6_9HEXA